MPAELSIVLVRPERPANVGAVARAMANFGWRDLRLVGARTGLPGDAGHSEARALAWNSASLLEEATVHDTLEAAVADLALVAAATARAEPDADTLTARAFAREVAELPGDSRSGCVFGPEDHGLSNVELDACRSRLRIPARGPQPSLNLAQSAVIVAYETAVAVDASPAPATAAAGSGPAQQADLERLAAAARDLGLRAGYLNPQAPEHVLGELKRLLARARPTAREVTLLQGLVAQLDWAQRERPD